MYGKVAQSPVQYGERKRPGHRSTGLLIYAQVAYAPRTVPLAIPYTHLQSDISPTTLRLCALARMSLLIQAMVLAKAQRRKGRKGKILAMVGLNSQRP